MKIKKILAFTLALIMTVGIFAGCGAQTETAAPVSDDAVPVFEPEEPTYTAPDEE